LAIAAAVLGAALIVQSARLARVQTSLARQQQQAAEATAKLSEEYRGLYQEHHHDMVKVDTTTHAKLAAARTDAQHARAAGERLQQQLAGYIADWRRAAAACAASGECAPSEHPADMLTDLQRRADGRAGELAEIADDARVRGQACEQQYDAAQLMMQRAASAARAAAGTSP
jgi:hypothetical protein